ncbi:PGPGW domain-containing protein [Allorhodopirellula solitaria]|uniref:Putative transmembrane protein (PGPGW) n=1 Tax=Allorhodopirellula solitaria TaxID=2527987 RepID=A0A5C5XT11_9BACT|nr:PGPGW domain-containing protein [Allorhodopirellula solitaria]TWT65145.1 putative transmembrane protein (PGPGW) [Allorhodopirellula solitaria]
MLEFLTPYREWLVWLASISGIGMILAIVLLPVLFVKIPADYFTRPPNSPTERAQSHPWLIGGVWVLRNLLGVTLIMAGVAMLVLPGQGLLTIFAGLMLTTFPGKRRFEVMILQRPIINKTINRMRRRYGKEPLHLPPREDEPSQ